MPRKPFPKGRSPNPAGRPRGIPDRRTAMREALAAELPAIVRAVIAKAVEGDTASAALILSHCMPRLRPQREPIDVPGLKADASPTEVARQIVRAATAGEIAPDIAAELVQALASVARLREVDELAARISKLEEGNAHE